MAIRMTHLVWRKGWAYFRLKLPDDLASKPVPTAWPDDLITLVNTSRRTFKVELWKSLELTKKDEQRAKRIVAAKVSSIKRAHVRSFRDAMVRLPKHLPHDLQKLPLPRLLEQIPEGLEKRSARTINKSLRLLSAITNAVANEYDFAERPGGWRNPFHKIVISVEVGEDDRLPFNLADLKSIFTSPVYAEAKRPKGGTGEAAFWFPLISLYTGARLRER